MKALSKSLSWNMKTWGFGAAASMRIVKRLVRNSESSVVVSTMARLREEQVAGCVEGTIPEADLSFIRFVRESRFGFLLVITVTGLLLFAALTALKGLLLPCPGL